MRLVLRYDQDGRETDAHDQVMWWTKAKVRVYSDSVLCLVKMWANKGGSSGRIQNVFVQRITGN